jgi:dTDP-4-amino-4,6-dideoxygalactose transaminase
MINLFNIPNHKIDTLKLGHLLHGDVVKEFEEAFAEYVGANYACFANSASSLMFIALRNLNTTIKIPSIIPSVVPNVIINTKNKVSFYDNIDWVGNCYKLVDGIWDSAQEVSKNQYQKISSKISDVIIFSFYPTKPISGCDGGMIVSDSKYVIDHYRTMINNGSTVGQSWDIEQSKIGYKMHGNSIQATIAYENFKNLENKNRILEEICLRYNDEFGYNNTSRHLYRIRVKDNNAALNRLQLNGIKCGIHYKACHKKIIFRNCIYQKEPLLKSELEEKQTLSIPFHENLTTKDVDKVIENVKKLGPI